MTTVDNAGGRISRRRMLEAMGVAVAGAAGYVFLDSQGYLGSQFPIRRYARSLVLSGEAAKFGDNGDRVAYAVNYLGLPPSIVGTTVQSWESASSNVKQKLGNAIPTATAAIVAEELSHPATAQLAQRYPNLLWIHAHSNAIFAFPWLTHVQDRDARLTKLADLRFSEGPTEVQGQILDLYYPEDDPNNPSDYGKRRYVREAFAFFAENFGEQLDTMDPSASAIITEQSIASAVTTTFSGRVNNIPTNSGDTFIFFDTQDLPTYCYTAVDNTVAIGDLVQYGSLAMGIATMKRFRERHPGLADSPSFTLSEQGYDQIDDIFIRDPDFQRYLYQGFYKGAFSTNPLERTFSWKEYQSVGLVAEQTVRGFDVALIQDFHPAYCQPLSLLEADPSIDELLVQSPEVYVPSQWHLGRIFEPYTPT